MSNTENYPSGYPAPPPYNTSTSNTFMNELPSHSQSTNAPSGPFQYVNANFEPDVMGKGYSMYPTLPPTYETISHPTQQNPTIMESIGHPVEAIETLTNVYKMRYARLHIIFGTLSIVIGGIIMIIDPLLPAIFRYIYSIFCVGLFMLISGVCSILGSRKNSKCYLTISLTLNSLASILVFISYVIGLLVASGLPSLTPCGANTRCYINRFYSEGFQGIGIFNSIFGLITFVFIIWDSSLKCGDICCNQTVGYSRRITNVEVITIE